MNGYTNQDPQRNLYSAAGVFRLPEYRFLRVLAGRRSCST